MIKVSFQEKVNMYLTYFDVKENDDALRIGVRRGLHGVFVVYTLRGAILYVARVTQSSIVSTNIVGMEPLQHRDKFS